MAGLGSLILFVAAVVIAAASGVMFSPGAWYAALNKPAWTPPNDVFPIAWTILYAMIAIAGWLTWRAGGWSKALAIWIAALLLNALWSYLMFERHEIGLALADLGVLWLAIAAFIAAAWPLERRAAYLFMPYLAWVTFAFALNHVVWQMN